MSTDGRDTTGSIPRGTLEVKGLAEFCCLERRPQLCRHPAIPRERIRFCQLAAALEQMGQFSGDSNFSPRRTILNRLFISVRAAAGPDRGSGRVV